MLQAKATCLSLLLQDRLQLVELGLHGVHHSIGFLQLVKPIVEAVLRFPILCLLLSKQAGVQADQVRVALGAGVVPVQALALYEDNYRALALVASFVNTRVHLELLYTKQPHSIVL